MTELIDIDDFVDCIRAAAMSPGMVRSAWIDDARELQQKMNADEVRQIVIEARKMQKIELRQLMAVGLRKEARKQVLRELRDREFNRE